MPSEAIEIRAAVCREFGKPLSIETLRLDPPRGSEVRVKVLASSICHSDIIYMDGGWGGGLPAVFGHEVAGVVTDVGAAVLAADIGVGDRVLVSLLRSCGRCELCEAGIPTQCVTEYSIDTAPRLTDGAGRPVRAGLRVGGFAESVVVDSSQVVKIPVQIADEPACLISCGVMTGFGAAINTAQVQVGDAVAVVGCGGVGLNCVQGAALAGALPLLARDGALVAVGMPPGHERVALNATGLAHHGQRILGSKMGSARLRIDVPKLFRLYRSGRLKLDELISSRRPLDEINASIELSRQSRNLRHVIVFPDGSGAGG